MNRTVLFEPDNFKRHLSLLELDTEAVVLTVEDCIGLVELPEEVIEAIAEQEHIPEVVAAELAEYLIERPDGDIRIKAIIQEDIQRAIRNKNYRHASLLVGVLTRFIEIHK